MRSQRRDIEIASPLPSQAAAAVLAALEAAGALKEGMCDRCKCMFCMTEVGRSTMCRQLAPALHIDTSVLVRAPKPTRIDTPAPIVVRLAPIDLTLQYVSRLVDIWHRISHAWSFWQLRRLHWLAMLWHGVRPLNLSSVLRGPSHSLYLGSSHLPQTNVRSSAMSDGHIWLEMTVTVLAA